MGSPAISLYSITSTVGQGLTAVSLHSPSRLTESSTFKSDSPTSKFPSTLSRVLSIASSVYSIS